MAPALPSDVADCGRADLDDLRTSHRRQPEARRRVVRVGIMSAITHADSPGGIPVCVHSSVSTNGDFGHLANLCRGAPRNPWTHCGPCRVPVVSRRVVSDREHQPPQARSRRSEVGAWGGGLNRPYGPELRVRGSCTAAGSPLLQELRPLTGRPGWKLMARIAGNRGCSAAYRGKDLRR
jgi:hypothetical protein